MATANAFSVPRYDGDLKTRIAHSYESQSAAVWTVCPPICRPVAANPARGLPCSQINAHHRGDIMAAKQQPKRGVRPKQKQARQPGVQKPMRPQPVIVADNYRAAGKLE